AEKRGVYRSGMRRVAGEEVVAVEVRETGADESRPPADALEARADMAAEPADHAQLTERAGHHQHRAEPDERIPRLGLVEEVVPSQDAGDEQKCDRDQRGG